MKLLFTCEFDGVIDVQPGDRLELLVTGKKEGAIHANIVRQTGVRPSPPDLGISVSDSTGISDRLG